VLEGEKEIGLLDAGYGDGGAASIGGEIEHHVCIEARGGAEAAPSGLDLAGDVLEARGDVVVRSRSRCRGSCR
jgi:hypothetical protein